MSLSALFFDVWVEMLAGILIAGLILFARYFWLNLLQPYFEEMAYREVKIEGQYKAEIRDLNEKAESPEPDLYNIELSRKGHSVRGEMTDAKGNKWKLEGEFRNMIMTLLYETTSDRHIDRGCFTLLLMRNGKEFRGYAAYYHDPSHTIHAAEMVMRRKA